MPRVWRDSAGHEISGYRQRIETTSTNYRSETQLPEDASGHELHVGDTVLLTGTVVQDFGDGMIQVRHVEPGTGKWFSRNVLSSKCVQLRDKVFEPSQN